MSFRVMAFGSVEFNPDSDSVPTDQMFRDRFEQP